MRRADPEQGGRRMWAEDLRLSRRTFVQLALGATIGSLLAACSAAVPAQPTAVPAKPTDVPKPAAPAPTSAPAAPASASKPATTAAPASAASLDQWVAAANQEGKIVIGGPAP